MRSYVAKEFGGNDSLELVDLPPEPLSAGQVRVKPRAISLNYRDF